MSEISHLNEKQDSVQFVVLAHDEPGGGRHFDLMIEQGESLATWRCPVEPEHAAAIPLTLQRIADHRLHYLTYEGPISGNRGSVSRHDEGRCTVLRRDDVEWLVDWSGRRLKGRFSLRATGPSAQSWSFESLEK